MVLKGQVFVSYNSHEREHVEKLSVQLLNRWAIRTFVDRLRIPPGAKWEEKLNQAFARSVSCLVIVGKSGVGSYQEKEIDWAKARQMSEPAYKVIPILFPGATESILEKLDSVLPGLHRINLENENPSDDFSGQALGRIFNALLGEGPGPLVEVRDLAKFSESWTNNHKDKSELIGGPKLKRYLELAENTDDLDELSKEYLNDCVACENREQKHKQRNNNIIFAVLISALIIAVAVGIFFNKERIKANIATAKAQAETEAKTEALKKEAEAQKQKDAALSVAKRQRTIAIARKLAADSELLQNSTLDVELPALLAIESIRRQSLAENGATLRKLLNILPKELAITANGKAAQGTTNHGLPHNYSLPVTSITSMDQRWVANVTHDTSVQSGKTVQISDAATGKKMVELAHNDTVLAMAFSPDGNRLVTGSFDSTVGVWGTRDGKKIASFQHSQPVHVVTFSPDGRWVAAGDQSGFIRAAEFAVPTPNTDGTVRVWDIGSGSEVARIRRPGNASEIAFGSDGHRMEIIWDNQKLLYEIKMNEIAYLQHDKSISAIAFSPDGSYIDSGEILWKLTDNKIQWQKTDAYNGDSSCGVAFSPDGRWIVRSAGESERLSILDAMTGKVRDSPSGWGRIVCSVALSPDGRWITDGNEVRELTGNGSTNKLISRLDHLCTGSTAAAYSSGGVAFSPNGRWIASGCADGVVRLWDATTGKTLADLPHHRDSYVSTVAFSPDGRWLATGSGSYRRDGRWLDRIYDCSMQVWDMDSHQKVRELSFQHDIVSVKFITDREFVVNTSNNITHLLDVSGKEAAQIPTAGRVLDVYWHKNSRFILLAEIASNEARIIRADLDPKDLIDEGCSRLTRNLTLIEWRQYLGEAVYDRTCGNLPFPSGYQSRKTSLRQW